MINTLKDYFLLPLIKVTWSSIVSIFTLNFDELNTNLTLRFPLILILGLTPFFQKVWFEWYKLSDKIQQNVLGVFDPASTAKRILNNPLCPKETFKDYCNNVTSLESCLKRINER